MLRKGVLRLRNALLPATGPGRVARWVYEAAARALCAYLTRGVRARGYARGSLAIHEVAPGHSDLDLAVVAAGPADRARADRRWKRLRASGLVDMAIYDQGELNAALSASLLTSETALQPGVPGPRDEASLRVRPGVPSPLWDWRALGHGPGLLPRVAEPGPHERDVAAWLELQFIWRVALAAEANPSMPHVVRLGLKLAADPARVWLWLSHGEVPSTRAETLARVAQLLPEEAAELGVASRTRSAAGALASGLPLLMRLSERIAALVTERAAGADQRRVRLVGDVEGEAPLVDWHALAFAPRFEETLADARRHGALLVAGGGGGWARPAQCAATDPVSFALLAGRDQAVFPELPGWSAADWARRAVAEHRAWLVHKDRDLPSLKALTRLLAAARAARFAESLDGPDAELAITSEAIAERIGNGSLGAEAVHEARERAAGAEPEESCVDALRRTVRALPAYSGRAPALAGP